MCSCDCHGQVVECALCGDDFAIDDLTIDLLCGSCDIDVTSREVAS
jgi:hypothetical protein